MSLLITLEGPDGSGKSSQACLLAEHLSNLGQEVLLTREPGGTSIGDQIRQVLMSLENTRMRPETEFLLFSASRSQLVNQVVRPHLNHGGLVVCDRFFHSSLAYQGYGHGLNLEALRMITRFATGGLSPDLVILLDLPIEVGLRRRGKEGNWNRLDAYEVEFHRRVRKGYLAMAAADPEHWKVMDASRPPDLIQEGIRRTVEGLLG